MKTLENQINEAIKDKTEIQLLQDIKIYCSKTEIKIKELDACFDIYNKLKLVKTRFCEEDLERYSNFKKINFNWDNVHTSDFKFYFAKYHALRLIAQRIAAIYGVKFK